jgi:hypothetical protein
MFYDTSLWAPFYKIFNTVINCVHSKLMCLLLSITLNVLAQDLYATGLITDVKNLITQALCACITKLFTEVISSVCIM